MALRRLAVATALAADFVAAAPCDYTGCADRECPINYTACSDGCDINPDCRMDGACLGTEPGFPGGLSGDEWAVHPDPDNLGLRYLDGCAFHFLECDNPDLVSEPVDHSDSYCTSPNGLGGVDCFAGISLTNPAGWPEEGCTCKDGRLAQQVGPAWIDPTNGVRLVSYRCCKVGAIGYHRVQGQDCGDARAAGTRGAGLSNKQACTSDADCKYSGCMKDITGFCNLAAMDDGKRYCYTAKRNKRCDDKHNFYHITGMHDGEACVRGAAFKARHNLLTGADAGYSISLCQKRTGSDGGSGNKGNGRDIIIVVVVGIIFGVIGFVLVKKGYLCAEAWGTRRDLPAPPKPQSQTTTVTVVPVQEAPTAPEVQTPAPQPAAPIGGDAKVARIREFAQLRDSGVLTQAEFELEKAKVLAMR